MSWWHDASHRGRTRRAAIGLGFVAVLSGVRAGVAGDALVRSVAAVAAGLSLLSAVMLVWLGQRASKVADERPKLTFDPSRYLAQRPGREVSVASLRKTKSRHQRAASMIIGVTLMALAVAMAKAGASDRTALAVVLPVVGLLVVPAMFMVAIDGLRIDAAISHLLEEPQAPRP